MNRREILAAMQGWPRGMLECLRDLLEMELEDARLELETGREEISMWRAQGRAMEIRSLMNAVKPGRMER